MIRAKYLLICFILLSTATTYSCAQKKTTIKSFPAKISKKKSITNFIKYPSFIVDDIILPYYSYDNLTKNSALKSIDEALKVKLLNSYTLINEKKFTEARNALEDIILSTEKISDMILISKIMNTYGVVLCKLKKYDAALTGFKKAYSPEISKSSKMLAEIISFNIANTHYLNKKYKNTNAEYERIINGINSDIFVEIKGYVLTNLSSFHIKNFDFDKAHNISLEGLDLGLEIKNRQIELISSLNLSKVYFAKEEYQDVFNRSPFEDSVKYASASLNLSRKLGLKRQEIETLLIFGFVSLESGVIEDADEIFSKAFDISDEISFNPGLIDALCGMGEVSRISESFDEAFSSYNDALILSKKDNYDLGILKSLSGLADTYYAISEFKKAIDFHMEALNISKKTNNSKIISQILFNISKSYFNLNEFDPSLEYSNRSLTLSKSINFKKGIIRNQTYLGQIYRKKKDIILAVKFSEKAINSAGNALTYRNEVGVNLNTLANIAFDNNHLKKAKKLFLKSHELSSVMGNTSLSIDNKTRIGLLYQIEDDLEIAFSYFFDALQLAKKTGAHIYTIENLINLGSYYRSNSKNEEALKYYKEALSRSKKINYKIGLANCYALIGLIEFIKEDFSSSTYNLNKALTLYDELKYFQDVKYVQGILNRILEGKGE